MGNLAMRKASANVRPSVLLHKSKQQMTYISAITAIAVAKLKPGEGMPDEIELYVVLPPAEVKTSTEAFSDEIKAEYTVTFNKIEKTVTFKITNVYVYAESYMAILAYFFDSNGKVREKALRFAKGTVLSLDIGASTTDLAVVTDMKYLEKSGQTYRTGGNIARDIFIDAIREKYEFDMPIEAAELAIAEGRLQLGNSYVTCQEEVYEAKRGFALQIVEMMNGYFRKIGIPIQMIRAIVVSGGGSMAGSYVDSNGNVIATSEPMSSFITTELSKVCDKTVIEQFENPRMANIIGLYIRANVNEVIKANDKESKTPKKEKVDIEEKPADDSAVTA
jgi:hypothetical protein